MEVLEMISTKSFVPKLGTDELTELWYDFVDAEKLESYNSPVFTIEEQDALRRFYDLLECHYDEIPTTHSLDELSSSESWRIVSESAASELAVFMERGYLDEESEVT
mgnify:CR=1 FL=1